MSMKKNENLTLTRFFYAVYVIMGITILSLLLLCLPACSNSREPDLYYPTALVTACTQGDSVFILQLDDSTTLYPSNITRSPFGREVRALVNYSETDVANHVYINWIDSIRTKFPMPTMGTQNDSLYGADPIEIVRDWVTIAEDGYLTLRVRTLWSGTGKKHNINLLMGTNPDNPFELQLRHDALGDVGGTMGDALIAFNLNALCPSANPIKMTLKWQSFSGEKSVEFDLRPSSRRPVFLNRIPEMTSCVN